MNFLPLACPPFGKCYLHVLLLSCASEKCILGHFDQELNALNSFVIHRRTYPYMLNLLGKFESKILNRWPYLGKSPPSLNETLEHRVCFNLLRLLTKH